MTCRAATVCALLVCCLLAGCAGGGVDPAAADRRASLGSGQAREGGTSGGQAGGQGAAASAPGGVGIVSPAPAGSVAGGPGSAPRTTAASGEDLSVWESGRMVAVTVYFVRRAAGRLYLVPEQRQVGASAGVVESAARLALAERPVWAGPVNPMPPGTRLLGFGLVDGTATLDLSREVLSWRGSAEEARYSVQALACTLASVARVDRLRVRVEGRAGGVLDGHDVAGLWGGLAVTRPAQSDRSLRLAPITLTHPRPGTFIADGRLWIQGEASTGQGMVSLRLRDSDGQVVAQNFTTAEYEAPKRGAFSTSLPFTPPRRPSTWSLEVFEADPSDGTVTYQVKVPILVGG